ncbi:unnamed protein product [Penicillium bialowiezense]
MSWLFGSSNGEFQCLHFLLRVQASLRNAPALQFAPEITKCPCLPLLFIDKSAAAPEQAPAQAAQTEKPKPCCVCKPEKTTRDDCMLFSKSDNPEEECKPTIEKYKECMAGFGFKV